MRRHGISGLVVLLALTAPAAAEEQQAGAVQGRVSVETAPLSRVTVYAYELAQLQIHKAVSGAQGEFRFDRLPAGVYKLIAFKVGYEPAVLMLSRAATEALQFVELRLAREQTKTADPRQAEGFWAVRDQIPPDVLRDIASVRLSELAIGPAIAVDTGGFSTAVRAVTGVSNLGGSEVQLAGGGIGMEGRIGSVALDVNGDFWRMAGGEQARLTTASEAAALEVRMAASGEGMIDVATVSHRLPWSAGPHDDSADFERYRLRWSQPFGERSSSRFEAQYTSQSNFFRPPTAAAVSSDTRAFNLEGAYMLATERSSLETGIRYRERATGTDVTTALAESQRALELFGKGGWQLQPSVLVEYGMFTQLRDGSLALAPQGGVVVQLGDRWQALANASYRLERGDAGPLQGSTPVRFSGADATCRDLEQQCYRVLLARQGDNEDSFAIGAVHRELAETLHLYFDDDFLSRLESLYLVQGDRVPELQMVVERRLAPRVLARLESSYARGGGGILYAVGDTPYENRVRYLVTSLDTRFQHTNTGVFVAFHQIQQGAEPVTGASRAAVDGDEVATTELERLQLMLSQDLNVLARLAADWAVHVNFELSRGTLPFSLRDAGADELRRRVTGGLTVKF